MKERSNSDKAKLDWQDFSSSYFSCLSLHPFIREATRRRVSTHKNKETERERESKEELEVLQQRVILFSFFQSVHP